LSAHSPALEPVLSQMNAAHSFMRYAVDETLRYKPGGRGFDSRWCHWNFSLT